MQVRRGQGAEGGVCFFGGVQTFFCLTEPESDHAELAKENLQTGGPTNEVKAAVIKSVIPLRRSSLPPGGVSFHIIVFSM